MRRCHWTDYISVGMTSDGYGAQNDFLVFQASTSQHDLFDVLGERPHITLIKCHSGARDAVAMDARISRVLIPARMESAGNRHVLVMDMSMTR